MPIRRLFLLVEELNVVSENNKELNILVVDDESFILNLTVKILNKLGYENVETANSGKKALDLVIGGDTAFNVIICDLNMPEMDGVELMRHVKDTSFEGGIILFSGEDKPIIETAIEVAASLNLNILSTLSKPLRPDVLEDLLVSFQTAREEQCHVDPETPLTDE